MQNYLLTFHSVQLFSLWKPFKSKREPAGASSSCTLLAVGSQSNGVIRTVYISLYYLRAVASLSTSPGRLVLAAAQKTRQSSTHSRIPTATHAHGQASTLDRCESMGSSTHTHTQTHTHTHTHTYTPYLPTPPHTAHPHTTTNILTHAVTCAFLYTLAPVSPPPNPNPIP